MNSSEVFLLLLFLLVLSVLQQKGLLSGEVLSSENCIIFAFKFLLSEKVLNTVYLVMCIYCIYVNTIVHTDVPIFKQH